MVFTACLMRHVPMPGPNGAWAINYIKYQTEPDTKFCVCIYWVINLIIIVSAACLRSQLLMLRVCCLLLLRKLPVVPARC